MMLTQNQLDQSRDDTEFPALPAAVSGERRILTGKVGQLSCYSTQANAAQQQPPLLLIHSINAAGSAYEVRPLFEHYAQTRTVYAPDLPGFGFSDRSERDYTPALMTEAILALVEEIRQRHGPQPIDALALSLSAEFLARAATEKPSAFRTLALVSPTGLDRRAPYLGPAGSTRAMPWLRRIFTCKLWSRGFFKLLCSRVSMRFFLAKTWGAKNIDEGLLEYDYLTARQPGAEHAPYCFVSGYLFSRDVTRLYEALPMPVWMCHGVRGDFVDYSYKQAFAGRPNWHFQEFQTGALPHFEVLEEFVSNYDRFLLSVVK